MLASLELRPSLAAARLIASPAKSSNFARTSQSANSLRPILSPRTVILLSGDQLVGPPATACSEISISGRIKVSEPTHSPIRLPPLTLRQPMRRSTTASRLLVSMPPLCCLRQSVFPVSSPRKMCASVPTANPLRQSDADSDAPGAAIAPHAAAASIEASSIRRPRSTDCGADAAMVRTVADWQLTRVAQVPQSPELLRPGQPAAVAPANRKPSRIAAAAAHWRRRRRRSLPSSVECLAFRRLALPHGLDTPTPTPQVEKKFDEFVEQEVSPENTLQVVAGRAKVLVFREPPRRVYIPREDIAEYSGDYADATGRRGKKSRHGDVEPMVRRPRGSERSDQGSFAQLLDRRAARPASDALGAQAIGSRGQGLRGIAEGSGTGNQEGLSR